MPVTDDASTARPQPATGWVRVALLPHGKYQVREVADGWEVRIFDQQTADMAAASTAPPAEVDRYRAAVEAVKSLLPDSPPFGHVRVVDVWDALHDVTEHECADASTALPPPAGVVCVCAQHGPHPVTDHVYIPPEIAGATASTAPPTGLDVVRELRGHPIRSAWGARIAEAAADEIDRLRAEADHAWAVAREVETMYTERLIEVSAERDALRTELSDAEAALHAAASTAPPADGPHE